MSTYSQLTVIPPSGTSATTAGGSESSSILVQPLRTFVYTIHYKTANYTDGPYVFLAESKRALAEYWCQGGENPPPYWQPVNQVLVKIEPTQLPTDELLRLIDSRGSFYDPSRMDSVRILVEEAKPVVLATHNQIRAVLNSYLLPDLTNIILDLMRTTTVPFLGPPPENNEHR